MFYFLFISQFNVLTKIFGGGGCYLGEGVIDTKISGFTTQHKKNSKNDPAR